MFFIGAIRRVGFANFLTTGGHVAKKVSDKELDDQFLAGIMAAACALKDRGEHNWDFLAGVCRQWELKLRAKRVAQRKSKSEGGK